MKRRLADLADITPGHSFRSRVKHDPEGTFRVLRNASDIEDGTVAEEQVTKTSKVDPRERYLVDEKVVLFLVYGSNNRAYWLREVPPNTVAGSAFALIRPKQQNGLSIQPSYLAWYMNQRPARAFYERFRQQSTMAKIRRKSLGALEVPLPPAEVQRHIGEIDALIQKEARLTQAWIEKRRQLTDRSLLRRVEDDA